MVQHQETIAALSTPVGTAGLAVIRMTGPEALAIADQVFMSGKKKKPSQASSHTALYGWIQDGSEKIDEVILLVLKAPHSFTGEDTVEINCHGGMYICHRVLEVLMKAGAQPAEPGEFSKRAFLNGRLDLAQAEAVMDMIGARTAYSLRAAVKQRGNALHGAIESMRSRLIDMMVKVEVNIDYPEYDEAPEIDDNEIMAVCKNVQEACRKLLDTADAGRFLAEGINVALIGMPNVGKSSLLNRLLGRQRALVTNIPGTTRDVLEEMLDLDGIPLRMVDTAGIRTTEDEIEKLGIERSYAALEESDLVLMILDASRSIKEEEKEIVRHMGAKPYLLLLNKSDISRETPAQVAEALREIDEKIEDKILPISALQGSGIEALTEKIKNLFFAGDVLINEEPLLANLRQKKALMEAEEALDAALAAVGLPQDLVLIDVQRAADSLGQVIGRSTREDVIAEIFSRFCLGK